MHSNICHDEYNNFIRYAENCGLSELYIQKKKSILNFYKICILEEIGFKSSFIYIVKEPNG